MSSTGISCRCRECQFETDCVTQGSSLPPLPVLSLSHHPNDRKVHSNAPLTVENVNKPRTTRLKLNIRLYLLDGIGFYATRTATVRLNPALFILTLIWFHTMQVSSKEVQKFPILNSETSYDTCYNFTVGDESRGEFYSPNYPNNYPNQTECRKVITAPRGSTIKLEFRDHFNMEESPTCEYDRLEIRDGRYGYDKVLSVLCGHNFPHEINSTNRFLWLRFKSDESIEYSGFRGVYTWVPAKKPLPEQPPCFFHKGGFSGTLEATMIPEDAKAYARAHRLPVDCIWNITVAPNSKMYVNFLKYTLARPNDCEANFFDIYENLLSDDERQQRFCGTSTEPYKSKGNVVNIRLHVAHDALKMNFKILYTAFRELESKERCTKSEFDCEDGTCIDISLKCNGEENCKYRYDEDPNQTCFINKGGFSLNQEHMVVILIVFFALVIGMCASIVVSCWGKIQERKQRELEYRLRNQSRDGSMEQGLDRTITSTSLSRSLEAGFPVRLGTPRNAVKSGANLNTIIDDGHRLDEDENGCYVPDMKLGYYRKTPNGDPSILDEKYLQDSQNIGENIPSSDCPYYHHHQQESVRSGSESPIPPPPPPPALSHLRGRTQRASTLPLDVSKLDTPSPTDNHAAPPPPHLHHPDCAQHSNNLRTNPDYRSASVGLQHVSVVDDDPEECLDDDKLVPSSVGYERYRAEAVHQMGSVTGTSPSARPRSFVETRSTPDVIVLR